jgi:hypothetical protein
MKGKGEIKMLTVVLAIVVVLLIAGGIGWMRLRKEHHEAGSLPLNIGSSRRSHCR